MVTRRTSSMKTASVASPSITFGHLIVLIGICGIIFNVTINLNSSTDAEVQNSSSKKQQPTAGVRGLERGQPELHLSVPFYIYEESDLNWEDATLNGEPYAPAAPSAAGCDGKHSDDYWYLRAALNHPMRTRDPKQAKLFFVPILANVVFQMAAPSQIMNRRGEFCVHDRPGSDCFDPKDVFGLFGKVNDALGQSEYFQKSNGTDHLVVMSHFYARKFPLQYHNLLKCNTLGFEDEIPESAHQFDRIRTPGFYIGNPCEPVKEKTHDFAMIATFKHNRTDVWKIQQRAFQSRADVCEWLGSDKSVRKCGPGDQCPALAEARYGFHVRGDTWGSNRLMDTIMSRTVPIFTAQEQYEILPRFYPWREVSYYVDVSSKESFLKGIDDILSRPESEYKEKMRIIDENMHLLNHTQNFQFDGHMADIARQLGHQK